MFVSNTGYVYAWGDNDKAELGDFTYDPYTWPIKVGALPYRSLEMAHSVLFDASNKAIAVYDVKANNDPPWPSPCTPARCTWAT